MIDQYYDPERRLSQRTIVAMWQALGAASHDFRTDMLYANDFPEWFITHAENDYRFGWERILRDLRSSRFFFPGYCDSRNNITGQFLDEGDANGLGEFLFQRLAALLATTLTKNPYGQLVRRQLELDGYRVDENHLSLVALEGAVSEAKEEDVLASLVRQAGFPTESTILKHVAAARNEYIAGNDHPSVNESRSFVQALIDDITTETGSSGAYSIGVPGGTANRIEYLYNVGFFTADEKAAFASAWGALSAGSHPGVPAREEARIELILALEFGQLLVLKFQDWKKTNYKGFSRP